MGATDRQRYVAILQRQQLRGDRVRRRPCSLTPGGCGYEWHSRMAAGHHVPHTSVHERAPQELIDTTGPPGGAPKPERKYRGLLEHPDEVWHDAGQVEVERARAALGRDAAVLGVIQPA